MSPEAERFAKEALALPEDDRAALAVALLDSLEGEEAEQVDLDSLWEAEVARRIADADAGRASFESWTQLRRRLLGND